MNKHPVSDFQETDVDQVPFEWELVSLEEICTVHKQIFNPNGEQVVPYVGLEHLEPGNPKLLSWGTSSEVRSAKTFFYPNQVLYGKLRPYLDKAALATFEGVCSTDIMVFNVTDKATPDYLVNLLHTGSFLKYASSTMVGVNHPRTNWASLKEFKVSLPPLPEQRRIAAVLNAIQDAIAAQEDVITAARAFKRSLMQRLFTYGPGREPAETKETEIGEIPAHWKIKSCENICEKITVGIVVKPASYYVESGVPAFRSLNINEDKLDTSDLVYISPADNNTKLSKSKLQVDDVLIVRTGNPGTSCTVPEELEGANCIDLVIARANSTVLNRYLSRFFNTDIAKRQVLSSKTGIAQQHLNVGAVKRTVLPIPPLSEQKQVVAYLEHVDAKIAAEEDRKAALQAFFQSTLHQLMTGQIRLLHDEGLPL
jgi:type I restriction enzyme S subunit